MEEQSKKRPAGDHATPSIRPAKRRVLPWVQTTPVIERPKQRPAEGPETVRSVKQRESTACESATNDAGLCDRCRNIEWSKLVRKAPISRYGQVLDTLFTSQETLRQSHCRVCQLLASIFPPSLDFETCKLKAFSSRISFAYSQQSERECTVIYVVPDGEGLKERAGKRGWHQTGCLGLVDSRKGEGQCGARETQGQRINWGLVKGWMAICQKHSKQCKPDRKNRLRGLRVIDCQTRSVVGAPTICSYVALSYVWGQQRPDEEKHSEFPLVVEDSISVAKSLGLRYLWVDKYCIDQGGPNKQQEMDRMDQIYSQAELTIVAAAGANDRYGLPGVSTRSRTLQRKEIIGTVNLLQIPPHTSHTLRSSVWAGRGWTYQEGILSRRRLVFTDDQVSWVCNAMHCAETVRTPEEQLNKKDKDTPFEGFLPRMVNSNRGKEELWDKYRDIKGHIMEFSKRKLSDESDVLNAMLGIFNSFNTSSQGALLRHWHGLPATLSLKSKTLVLPLHWYHSESAKRREGFPSWSWAGWDGGVRMPLHDVEVPRDCEIEVQDHTESHIPLFQAMQSTESSSISPPAQMLITAKTMRVNLEEKTWGDLNDSFSQETQKGNAKFLDGLHAILPVTECVSALVYAYMDVDTVPEGELLGLILGRQSSKAGVGILLLEPHGESYWRVGILRYRDGRGTEPGNKNLSHVVYVDAEQNVLEDDVGSTDTCPLWLERAEVKTLGLL